MGYRFRKTIRYEGDAGTPFEGLWIEIDQVRQGDVLHALMATGYWIDLHEVMAPLVVGWNVEGYLADEETRDAIGELVPERTVSIPRLAPLPPPAEAGPEVFTKVDVEVKQWIRDKLQESVLYREPDAEGKDATPSGSTPDGERDETAASSLTSVKRPASRTSSRRRSAST